MAALVDENTKVIWQSVTIAQELAHIARAFA